MRRVLVRYKVHPDKAEENKTLIEKVFQELSESTPQGLRYASFVGEDGLTFYHLASIETGDGVNPLDESAAFKAFQEGIRDRCEQPPVATPITAIGAYRVFGEENS